MFRLLVLASAWLLWSGHYTLDKPLIAALGACSCIAVSLLYERMTQLVAHGPWHTLTWRTLLYLPWLAVQVVRANLAVARIVLSPSLPVSPCLRRVKASQRGEGAVVLHANSITLTPGTVSLATEPGSILVHALTHAIAEDLAEGEIDRRISALERSA